MDHNNDMDNIMQTTNDNAIPALKSGRIIGTTVERFADKFKHALRAEKIDFISWDKWNNLTHWYLFKLREGE